MVINKEEFWLKITKKICENIVFAPTYILNHTYFDSYLYVEALWLNRSSLNINQTQYDFQSSHTGLSMVGGVTRYEKKSIYRHF